MAPEDANGEEEIDVAAEAGDVGEGEEEEEEPSCLLLLSLPSRLVHTEE